MLQGNNVEAVTNNVEAVTNMVPVTKAGPSPAHQQQQPILNLLLLVFVAAVFVQGNNVEAPASMVPVDAAPSPEPQQQQN